MMSILKERIRAGNFTSSEIYKLMGTPAVAKTYIEEKNLERRFGLCLGTDVHTRDMAWGNFLEQRVLDLLPMEYQITSKTTDVHPTIPWWTGTKDLLVSGKKISEIKCYQRKNFGLYTNSILTKDTEVIKKNNPKEYWQIVSNCAIQSVLIGEAITYMPYESELPEIREMALNYAGDDRYKYAWIWDAPNENMAYLLDGGYYKNLNVLEFEVPIEDTRLLTAAVLKAAEKLIKP